MTANLPQPTQAQQAILRAACHALGKHGLVHAYGHCSLRLDEAHFLVSPAKPLALVTDHDPGIVVPLTAPLPNGVLGEVRIHREIYRRRAEVGGIVRSMPPKIMALSTCRLTPKPRHGLGAYFSPQPPLWDDPQLLRSDAQAVALAETIGRARAIVMRGNGAVTAGASLQEAVVLTFYLEDAARIEMECLACGTIDLSVVLSDEEAEQRATWSGDIQERMWSFLCAN